jgi:NitT/TauT family transport system ATP-binding protein/nitrate/nitrite transport system substrate-binding protein
MSEAIRLGLLRLSDAAPVILAAEADVFAAHGLNVSLSIEPSWANIADKLGYGLLDGAVMLPPLAMACALGLRGRATAMVVPMSLSANGNAITLANAWKPVFGAGAAGFKAGMTAARRRPVFAVVHGFSTHDLLLRYWLAAAGINPEEDVEITVLPPSDMPASMENGKIDGFCAGAPWGQVAETMGVGFIAVRSSEIWRDHPEKCLALRANFAAADPARTRSLLAALREAAAQCADPSRRPALAALLAQQKYLDLPAALVERSLDLADGGPVFDLNFPQPEHARWFAAQMLHWNKMPEAVMPMALALYRPDLYLAAGGSAPAPRVEMFCDGTK